jgi:hypothetical protein
MTDAQWSSLQVVDPCFERLLQFTPCLDDEGNISSTAFRLQTSFGFGAGLGGTDVLGAGEQCLSSVATDEDDGEGTASEFHLYFSSEFVSSLGYVSFRASYSSVREGLARRDSGLSATHSAVGPIETEPRMG